MNVLVDYDNIPEIARTSGPRYVADRICSVIQTIGGLALIRDRRIDLRLYGGWYYNDKLSNVGRRLAADIQDSFPFALSVGDKNARISISVAAELAHSLVCL